MISKEEVKRIAELARLGLAEEEIEQYQEELSDVLKYVEKMKKVDIADVEPTSHPVSISNVMRKDERKERLQKKKEKLLKLAPETKDGYLKVKSIL